MKRPSKEQKELEEELIYYLRLFNELAKRENAKCVIASIEEKIDELVGLLKRM